MALSREEFLMRPELSARGPFEKPSGVADDGRGAVAGIALVVPDVASTRPNDDGLTR